MVHRLTRHMSFMLVSALVIGLLFGMASSVHAASVEYQEASYNSSTGKVTYTTKTASNATEVDANTTAFSDGGWYVVNSTVTVSNRITVSGTANLILADGATLTASKGITVSDGNSPDHLRTNRGNGHADRERL